MRTTYELQWLAERVEGDLRYKRDQARILDRALENIQQKLIAEPSGFMRTRLRAQYKRVQNTLADIYLEIKALEVQRNGIERDLYWSGETYANLSAQWRANSDTYRRNA